MTKKEQLRAFTVDECSAEQAVVSTLSQNSLTEEHGELLPEEFSRKGDQKKFSGKMVDFDLLQFSSFL